MKRIKALSSTPKTNLASCPFQNSPHVDVEKGRTVLRQRKTQKVKSIPLNDSARNAIEELPMIDDHLFPISEAVLYDAFKEALERATPLCNIKKFGRKLGAYGQTQSFG